MKLAVAALITAPFLLSSRALPHSTVFAFAAEKNFAVSDDALYDAVRRRLADDPEVKGGTIQVEVKDGNVTLKGKVDNDKIRQKATKLAKKIKGVRSVSNQLTIE